MVVPLALALLVTTGLSSCGGGAAATTVTPAKSHGKHRVKPLRPVAYIYAGLPLKGPMASEGRAIREGISLAEANLRHHQGDIPIRFKVLDEAGRKTASENLKLTVSNANMVATDPHAVYYIGDLGAATEVSLPILNAAGIAQATPGDPFILKTKQQPGSTAPALLRLLPDYTVQAKADMLFFQKVPPEVKDDACDRVLAFAQKDPESVALVDAMYADAKSYGIQMPQPTTLTSKSSLTTAIEHQAPCGFVIAGNDVKSAVTLAKTLHEMFQNRLILGTSGLCNGRSRWISGAVHGTLPVPASLLWCTSPVLPLDQYTYGGSFIKLYESANHGAYPSPYAYYGYEAAQIGITLIDEYLGPDGDSRVAFRTDLSDPDIRDAILDTYVTLAGTDQSVLDYYGVYHANPATSEPEFFAPPLQVIKP